MEFSSTQYANLYSTLARDLISQGALTSMLGNSIYNDIYHNELLNSKEIKRYVIDYAKIGLLDYEGKYDEVDVEGSWVTKELRYDRAMKLTFDKLQREVDSSKNGMSIETLLRNGIKYKVIPEVDATNMEICWQTLSENKANISNSPTVTTVLSDILNAIDDLEENNLPASEQQLFISYSTNTMLLEALSNKSNIYITDMKFMNNSGLEFNLPSINGVAIQKMPTNRFYTKIQRYKKADQSSDPLKVGYAKADDGEAIAWLIVPRQYVDPITKLSDIKIKLDSVENIDDRNNKAAYNIFYDCFVDEHLKGHFRGALASNISAE